MSQQFEWDAAKANRNHRKHNVTFEEAMTVFADPLARLFDDPDHSATEKREIIIGHSAALRMLVVGRGRQPPVNADSMKKTTKRPKATDDLRAEYDFSAMKARPNPFAARMRGRAVVVVLEPSATPRRAGRTTAAKARRRVG